MTFRDESFDRIVMTSALRTRWTAGPRRAAMICAAIGVGLVLVLSVTGRLILPGTGHSDPLPATTVKRLALEDRPIRVGVQEADGRVESLAVSQQPEVGRLTVTADDMLVYAPPPNFNGRVAAGYEACWQGHDCRSGVVAITVRAVNDSPVARDDTAITGRGKAVAIDVLANDTDPDGDRLSIRSVAPSRSRGGIRIARNWIVWTPRPGFQGEARVPYAVMDGYGGTSRASVTIRVGASAVAPSTSPGVVELQDDGAAGSDDPRDPFQQPVPPPLSNDPPEAADDRVSVPAGGTVIIDVLANDRDPDGDRLSIDSLDVPGRGAVKRVGDRIQFSAPSDSGGEIAFAYTVVDRVGARGRSFVSVSVVPAPPRSP